MRTKHTLFRITGIIMAAFLAIACTQAYSAGQRESRQLERASSAP